MRRAVESPASIVFPSSRRPSTRNPEVERVGPNPVEHQNIQLQNPRPAFGEWDTYLAPLQAERKTSRNEDYCDTAVAGSESETIG
jgi:hypothetical protein